jgi:hypothetical protein
MPRIIVTTENPRVPRGASVLLDEDVRSVHLSTGHAAAQLIERLAWAISDAEETEQSAADDLPRPIRAWPGRARAGRNRPALQPVAGRT